MKIEKEDLRVGTIYYSPFTLTEVNRFTVWYINHVEAMCTVTRWDEKRNEFRRPETITIPEVMFSNEYEAQLYCITRIEEYLKEAKENLEKMKGEFNEK